MEEKQRHGSVPRLEWLGSVGWISMMSGFALVVFGDWLDQPLAVRDRLDPLPDVSEEYREIGRD